VPPTRQPDEHQLELRRAVGGRIRALRYRRGLSQERLGELTSFDRRTVGQYELGEASANVDALSAFARALGVEPWQLFRDD
jgi:transcriptional regulator with XRE-family HTH domain